MVIEKPDTLKVRAYKEIKSAIQNKTIDKDGIYSEQWFANNFQISRTPIREALLQLRQEGLIEIFPNRGFKIKDINISDAHDIFQLRVAIEGYCTSYMAGQINTEKAQAALKKAKLEQEKLKKNFILEHDLMFHIAIIEFSGNAEFLREIDRIRTRIDVYFSELTKKDNRPQDVIREHQKILDCIERGDALGAYRANEEHMLNSLALYEKDPSFDVSEERKNLKAVL